MAGKSVSLSDGSKYPTIDEAKAAFKTILNAGPVTEALSDADARSVMVLHDDYCRATNWPVPNVARTGAKRSYSRAEGRTTTCFEVTFANGKTEQFSYIKALPAIAKAQAGG